MMTWQACSNAGKCSLMYETVDREHKGAPPENCCPPINENPGVRYLGSSTGSHGSLRCSYFSRSLRSKIQLQLRPTSCRYRTQWGGEEGLGGGLTYSCI